MSAQSLVTSSQYPIIETGYFLTSATSTGGVTFKQPFPVGSIPVVILQNTSGTTWDDVILGLFQPTNTGFTWTQTGTPAPEIFGVGYMAILVPNTTA